MSIVKHLPWQYELDGCRESSKDTEKLNDNSDLMLERQAGQSLS